MFRIVINREVIAEMVTDGDMVPTIEAELSAFEIYNDFS